MRRSGRCIGSSSTSDVILRVRERDLNFVVRTRRDDSAAKSIFLVGAESKKEVVHFHCGCLRSPSLSTD